MAYFFKKGTQIQIKYNIGTHINFRGTTDNSNNTWTYTTHIFLTYPYIRINSFYSLLNDGTRSTSIRLPHPLSPAGPLPPTAEYSYITTHFINTHTDAPQKLVCATMVDGGTAAARAFVSNTRLPHKRYLGRRTLAKSLITPSSQRVLLNIYRYGIIIYFFGLAAAAAIVHETKYFNKYI